MTKIFNLQEVQIDFLIFTNFQLLYPNFKINIMSSSMSRLFLCDTKKAKLIVVKLADAELDSPLTWIPEEIYDS